MIFADAGIGCLSNVALPTRQNTVEYCHLGSVDYFIVKSIGGAFGAALSDGIHPQPRAGHMVRAFQAVFFA